MLWIAIGGYVVGVLGTAVALGARLRIASLEQELAQCEQLYRRALQAQIRPSGQDPPTGSANPN